MPPSEGERFSTNLALRTCKATVAIESRPNAILERRYEQYILGRIPRKDPKASRRNEGWSVVQLNRAGKVGSESRLLTSFVFSKRNLKQVSEVTSGRTTPIHRTFCVDVLWKVRHSTSDIGQGVGLC